MECSRLVCTSVFIEDVANCAQCINCTNSCIIELKLQRLLRCYVITWTTDNTKKVIRRLNARDY